MKTSLRKVITIILCLMAAFNIYSSAQISVGLIDTRNVFGAYAFNDHYRIELRQSVYSEKLKYQYFRITPSYSLEAANVALSAAPYFGMTYCNSYYNLGFGLHGIWHPAKIIGIKGTIQPHYDHGLGYTTCYLGGVEVSLSDDIDLLASFTNIPEYRECEKRIRGGFRFAVSNLEVKPEISVGVGSHEGRNIRMLVGMAYTFSAK